MKMKTKTKTQRLHLATALCLGLLMSVTANADSARGGPAINHVKGELSVMVIGSGGPQIQTSGRASASYLIFTDGQPRVLMDIGGGAFQRLAQSGAHIGGLNILLLSHLHIDHSGDLPAAIKGIYFDGRLQGAPVKTPIRVFGPDTNNPSFPSISAYLNQLFGSTGVYAYLPDFVNGGGLGTFGYTATALSPTFTGASVTTILDENGLVIKAIGVDHFEAPAVAYRIEYKGHSIAYSGDTHSSSNNMATIAQDADLLIYDTSILDTAPPAASPFAKRHTTPTRLGEIATMAKPHTLVLSHLTPISEPALPTIKQIIRDQGYAGKISVAEDLKVYNLGVDQDGDNASDGDDR
jgi:ribonuclease BN (tRNA processing enzyme)